jgi:hypothetical protein
MAKEPKAKAAPAPYTPPPYADADISAIQALHRGEATPEQQKRALDWWINVACATYDLQYRPGGQEGERDTSFALGRAFPGQQTVKLLRLNLNQLRKVKHG